jgi:hypothetical protein
MLLILIERYLFEIRITQSYIYIFLQNSFSKNINAVESQIHGLQYSPTSWTEIKNAKQILVKTAWPNPSKSVTCFRRLNV